MHKFKNLCLSVFCLFVFSSTQYASTVIIETIEMNDILSSVESHSLVLFDLDDTLIDSPVNLNSGKWIAYYWQTAPKMMPDKLPVIQKLMWHTSIHTPIIAVDPKASLIISDLQKRTDALVLGLTARPHTHDHTNGAQITAGQLSTIGIDFSKSQYPDKFCGHPSFHNGIVYSSGLDKGGHMEEILACTGYAPKKIIFIDDNLVQIQSVEKSMQKIGIPCDCFWYRRALQNRPNFSLLHALIQLEYLLNHQIILSDDEATALENNYANLQKDQYLYNLIVLFENRSLTRVDQSTFK